MIWTYMGPREEPPSLPDLEWISLPESHLHHSKIFRECNWVQALEGDIDSSHTSFLHSSLRPEGPQQQDAERDRGGYWNYKHLDRAPRLEVVTTDYGAVYGARRMAEEGMYYWRIAQFLFPFYTMVPPIGPRAGVGTRIWVPVDDEHVVFWSVSANPMRPVDGGPTGSAAAPLAGHYLPHATDWTGRWRLAASKANDYFIDRQVQRTETFTGIDGTNLQDQAITESMGPIYDRTQEHLGSADAMIIQVRQRLIEAANALRDDSVIPPGVDDPSVYRVRSASLVLPEDVPWAEGAREQLVARPGVPVATV